MEAADVCIAGGGPAGSACAWKLAGAGLDVIVMDRTMFPRDKLCAGWITPQVVDDLRLDTEAYRRGRTFQAITGFRTGLIGSRRDIVTSYGRVVSFGIRRSEFDHYLLERSGARLRLGDPITSIRREGAQWIVNDAVKAPMLVGAGGHFCPVARRLNGASDPPPRAAVVVAQEVELPVDPRDAGSFTIAPEIPELYFCRDLKGYGWCFRKQDHINIGLGRADPRSLPKATAEFVDFLEARGTIPRLPGLRWRGHAYLLQDVVRRRAVDTGALLVGDAAGLAYPQSGEGIRPAIESGLLGALTIIEAGGRYTRDRLDPYEARLGARFRVGRLRSAASGIMPSGFWTPIAHALLGTPIVARHLALDRWFLHARTKALMG